MNTIHRISMHTFMFVAVLLTAACFSNSLHAQSAAPLQELIGMNLEDAQAKLEQQGYEIAHSSLFKKEQLWYNEKQNSCVNILFEKKGDHKVSAVEAGDVAKCKEGVAAARKLWENYHDGQAPINDAKITEERKKLADAGFTVSYWVNDVSPGRSAEYWVNESAKKVKSIVWETATSKWAMTNDSDYSMGKNPAKNK